MLSELLEDYKDSDEEDKKQYIKDFKKQLWGSNFRFSSYNRYHKYKVNEKSLGYGADLVNLFKKYEKVTFRFCKSYHNSKKMSAADYIRIHINNMYGYLIVKDVYLNADYYKLLATPKNLYYETARKVKSGEKVDYNEIANEIDCAFAKAVEVKRLSHEKKLKLTWVEYKKLVNGYIDRIFNNYMTPEEYEEEHGWELNVGNESWSEDNYVASYFCKSLTGYMRNYVRGLSEKEEVKKYCSECDIEIENTVNNKKYCKDCAKAIKNKQNKKYYHLGKQKLIYQYG